jgi:hypothetical protein
MQAVKHFYNINRQGFHFLNQALVVLIPKKPNAERLTDFSQLALYISSVRGDGLLYN